MGIGTVLLSAATGFQLTRVFYEEAAYDVVEKDGAFEVREYTPRVVAETTVDAANQRDATRDGFRILAGYIFGANTGSGGGSEKVAMTTPVEAEPVSETIAMTTPVEAERSAAGGWRIAFTMPSEYRLADLPVPDDARINLRSLPGRTVAAIRFRGRATPEAVSEGTEKLMARIAEAGFVATGPVNLAFYDPPWVLPWFRRNEIIVPIDAVKG